MDPFTKKQIDKLKAGSEYGKSQHRKNRLKGNVTDFSMKSLEAFQRGDYLMAADYAELMRHNLERLAEQ